MVLAYHFIPVICPGCHKCILESWLNADWSVPFVDGIRFNNIPETESIQHGLIVQWDIKQINSLKIIRCYNKEIGFEGYTWLNGSTGMPGCHSFHGSTKVVDKLGDIVIRSYDLRWISIKEEFYRTDPDLTINFKNYSDMWKLTIGIISYWFSILDD